MTTDQYRHINVPPPPPFFGGPVSHFWPEPYSHAGGEGYTLAEARDAMERSFTMGRKFAADSPRTGAGRAHATITWAASDRQDLLVFALGGAIGGLACHVARVEGSPGASFSVPLEQVGIAADIIEAIKPRSAWEFCRKIAAEAEVAEDNARMRALALFLADAQAELLTRYGRGTDMPPVMIADMLLSCVPHAFATEAEVTGSDAADHAESPEGGSADVDGNR